MIQKEKKENQKKYISGQSKREREGLREVPLFQSYRGGGSETNPTVGKKKGNQEKSGLWLMKVDWQTFGLAFFSAQQRVSTVQYCKTSALSLDIPSTQSISTILGDPVIQSSN
jgi:hypothetical protein